MEIFTLIAEVGFPIASALAGGYLVFLTIKFILDGVTGSVQTLAGIIKSLENRVQTMNNDLVKIDALLRCHIHVTVACPVISSPCPNPI